MNEKLGKQRWNTQWKCWPKDSKYSSLANILVSKARSRVWIVQKDVQIAKTLTKATLAAKMKPFLQTADCNLNSTAYFLKSARFNELLHLTLFTSVSSHFSPLPEYFIYSNYWTGHYYWMILQTAEADFLAALWLKQISKF